MLGFLWPLPMNFLYFNSKLSAYNRMIGIAVSTMIATCNFNIVQRRPVHNDEVKLMPMLLSRMAPENSCWQHSSSKR